MNEIDKELYDKAYSYFEYHAGQRMNMINYFIGVFGACVALYGALILSIPLACALIALFLFVVSLLFYLIDIRNKFDVKQSQEVLCFFERKYGSCSQTGDGMCGAFLNEENKFLLYDRGFRKNEPDYKALKGHKKQIIKGEKDGEISEFVKKYPSFSENEVKASLVARPIPHLSSCIKFLYYICMAISIVGIAFAVFLFIIN